jgi:hypothetical protein
LRYENSSAPLAKQIRTIYTSYAIDALDTQSRDALKYYSKLAGSEKFSFDKRLNGMSQWVKDYFASGSSEQNKKVVGNAMREMNSAVRSYIMTQDAGNAKYLPAIRELEDKIAAYKPQLKVVEQPVANDSFFSKLGKKVRHIAAGAVLALAACAGTPSMQDYEVKAKDAWEDYVKKAKDGDDKLYSISALEDLISAHVFFQRAEDADKNSEQYTEDIKRVNGAGNAIAAKVLSKIDDKDTFLKYNEIAHNHGFLKNIQGPHKEPYALAKAKFSVPEAKPAEQPKPEPPKQPEQPKPADTTQPPQPEQPKPADTTQPPQPEQPKPADTTQPPQPAQPKEPKSVFEQNRISLAFGVGSMKSSQDRDASLDLRGYGLSVLGQGMAAKFREERSEEKIRETGVGAFAKADLDELAGLDSLTGVHLQVGAGAYQLTTKRESEQYDFRDDPNFTITTRSDISQKETDNTVSGLVKATVSDTTVGLAGYKNTRDINVDVTTRVEVINKFDPAGNYTDLFNNNVVITVDSIGGVASLEQRLSKELAVGSYFGIDLIEIPEVERDVEQYTLDLFMKVISEDKKLGLNLLVGQGLLDDDGEENDKFTKPRYAIVGGAELADWITVGGQFNRREDPDGSIMILLGANKALPYLINNKWQEHMYRLELLKEMHPELQKVYLDGLYSDFLWGIAQQNTWALLTDVGARRVHDLDQDEKTVFNGRGTLFIPVTKEFTGTVTPFIEWENLYKRYGLNLGGNVVGGQWRFFVEASREEYDGRKEEDEDFRAFGGVAFPF